MSDHHFIGWDVGGAHLKVARLAAGGDILAVEQVASPLWLGLGQLEKAITRVTDDFIAKDARHAITMTGEMADIFPDRRYGVTSLLRQFASIIPDDRISVYAGRNGWVPLRQAQDYIAQIASANWHATAACAAMKYDSGILIDIGSTTTDIIPFKSGTVCVQGWTDHERLRQHELVYTGIVRTPVMAVVQQVPFRGSLQNIAAENFATMADIYRLTGELLEHHDLMDTADSRGKSKRDSARRLARMVGLDVDDQAPLEEWVQLAETVADQQLAVIQRSLTSVLEGVGTRVLVGAGSGRFLVRKLAQRADCTYIDFTEKLQVAENTRLKCADCAAAVSVAELARISIQA